MTMYKVGFSVFDRSAIVISREPQRRSGSASELRSGAGRRACNSSALVSGEILQGSRLRRPVPCSETALAARPTESNLPGDEPHNLIRMHHHAGSGVRAPLALLLLALGYVPSSAVSFSQSPGWQYSPIAGEGDKATLGCSRNARPESFACIAVRCEDDFSTGLYVQTSDRHKAGDWEVTIDRENATLSAGPTTSPYDAKFAEDQDQWLLDRLRQGTFVYLRHVDDEDEEFDHISLSGSLYAINRALALCAPRVKSDAPTSPDGE
jgi:hypothetical protein